MDTFTHFNSPTLPGPRPELSPGDIVRLIVEGLDHNDEPFEGAGIATAYRFASPARRVAMTPDAHAKAFEHEAFAPLLEHAKSVTGRVLITDGVARVPVIVTSESGSIQGYLFMLTRQVHGEEIGCWTVDDIQRFEVH